MASQQREREVTFKGLFVPFTTVKAIVIISVIGFVIFSSGLFNSFVWDDQPQITQNPIIQSLTNFPLFFSGGTFYSGTDQSSGFSYKPLLNLSFAVNYAIGGGSSLSFHVFQIFLYIINAILLIWVFRKFFNLTLSFALSLIFLVHPINSESSIPRKQELRGHHIGKV